MGGGGREHALAWRLASSPSVAAVRVLPGNAGTDGVRVPGSKTLIENVAGDPQSVAKSWGADLVVIGPEAPLCDGLVDKLSEAGILAYGPSAAAAQLEASKSFMKDFAQRHGIKTAPYRVLTDVDELEARVREFELPPVVKADGLCAGKGVVVSKTHDEAIAEAADMVSGARFGDAGRKVVLEQRIGGAEASIHAICDGQRAVILPAAQDHKRIGEGDTGPNTGGMGTYAPAPLVDAAMFAHVREKIVQPVIDGMLKDGIPFRGTLFAGLMIPEGEEPYLLEINVRFGDPETQVMMPLIEGDFAELLVGSARGDLAGVDVSVKDVHALCVVLASAGYPASSSKGDVIGGFGADSTQAVVFHAGTRRDGERVVTNGGRVLGVTGMGASLRVAADNAYRAVSGIEFDGVQYRRDIGYRALK